MRHLEWEKNESNKQVICVSNTAEKYQVNHMLTVGNTYDVINKTDEFIFIIDNSNRVAGYYKRYFKAA